MNNNTPAVVFAESEQMRHTGALPRRLSMPPILLTLLLALAASTGAEEASGRDPWEALGQLRAHLASEPIEVDFVQTFIPFGFTNGDQESGTMGLKLPDCIRWDYLDPFPKTYLLCGDTAYAWNPGEQTGRRYEIAEQDRSSLELLRLSTERMRTDYVAELTGESEEGIEIELTPKITNPQVESALLVTTQSLDRLTELSYKDAAGNLTRFEMTEPRQLRAADRFTAPSQITWLED
jgi:outer membrane lipoprotein-sorting protein